MIVVDVRVLPRLILRLRKSLGARLGPPRCQHVADVSRARAWPAQSDGWARYSLLYACIATYLQLNYLLVCRRLGYDHGSGSGTRQAAARLVLF